MLPTKRPLATVLVQNIVAPLPHGGDCDDKERSRAGGYGRGKGVFSIKMVRVREGTANSCCVHLGIRAKLGGGTRNELGGGTRNVLF